jgi:hypothetical protein
LMIGALIRAEVCPVRWMEDDYVSEPGARVRPVGQDPLVDRQRGQHRSAWDSVGLDEERLDQQGETYRNANRGDEFCQRPQTASK